MRRNPGARNRSFGPSWLGSRRRVGSAGCSGSVFFPFSGFIVLFGCLALGNADPARAQAEEALPRGYISRPCGFDLDDDGILGEPSDCRVCNAKIVEGRVSGGSLDPDGDGVLEDLVYVDCDAGRDAPRCGRPGQPPCRTLGHALNAFDGPRDGAEDIACFRGTCRAESDLTPAHGGLERHHRVQASGNQARSFEFPSDPAMIVGWDRDGDGAYPPFDPDDIAVLDGEGASRAFFLNRRDRRNRFFEMAHFTARDYGRSDAKESGGFLKLSEGEKGGSHLYLHDLVLANINRDRASTSGRITFDFFGLGEFRHGAFINLLAEDNGGYLNRGAAPYEKPGSGPFRWQNITVSAHSCDESGDSACAAGPVDAYWTGWKLWGFFEGLEILDSVIDANLDAWKPKREGGPIGVQGIVAAECSVDWTIRNNEFIDAKTALKVQNHAPGFCDGRTSRPVDLVVFDRNLVRNDRDWWKNGLIAVQTGPGGALAQETNGSVTISNNRFLSKVGWDTTIDFETGNGESTSPGRLTVSGNEMRGFMRTDESAFLRVRSPHPFPQHEGGVLVQRNLFCGVGKGQQNIRTRFAVSGWEATGNSYDPDGHFAWAGERTPTLASWRALTKQDLDSRMETCAAPIDDGIRRDVQKRPPTENGSDSVGAAAPP